MKRFLHRLGVAAALAAFALPGVAEQLTESFSGSAYAMDSNQLLYRETHYLFAGDNGGERVVLYQCPDGRAFARKRSHDDGNAQAPDFDLVDARVGYREGVRRTGDQREVYVQRTAAQAEQADPLRLPADGVIDTGFESFARLHWAALVRGDTLAFDYLVPSRRKFFAFKVGKIDLPTAPPGSVTFRLESSSWLSFLLPHIDISYDLATRRLVHYEGLSNVRDVKTGKNYRVHYEYPKIAVAHDVSPAQIQDALTTPLAPNCTAADKLVSANGH
ncbi:MAG TPA: hypothetical protein VHQ21_17230 [Rhodanobacteraceae bacterium]|jgi:hypothetical protein|nr:hypothetical protein [Rhodanobacteraceae bacterium]